MFFCLCSVPGTGNAQRVVAMLLNAILHLTSAEIFQRYLIANIYIKSIYKIYIKSVVMSEIATTLTVRTFNLFSYSVNSF